MDGIIVINKPKNCTSHDVVRKAKKILNEKVGHTGTLDPNATGVLPLLVGKGTQISKYLINHDKTYEAVLKLGEKTDTADVEGQVIETKEVHKLREFRTVPISKLVARLGLKKYDVECPIDDTLVKADKVKIMLSQSIGAPSVACVNKGDAVKVGDVVGKAPEKLGTAVHASIDGVVTEVNDKYVIIAAK